MFGNFVCEVLALENIYTQDSGVFASHHFIDIAPDDSLSMLAWVVQGV